MSGLEALLERWESDSEFRAALRQDADAAVAASGIALSDEERLAVKAMDWSQSNEALGTRVSKMEW